MERLDKALVSRSLARSRAEAQELIAAGRVSVSGTPAARPSLLVDDTTKIDTQGERLVYVSRGGLKLEAAFDGFAVVVAGRRALDVGASTGGWTDCLLRRGAQSVVALDVGHGQMAAPLARDPRVELREGVNARYLAPSDFPRAFDLIVGDLSFISLTLVLPALLPLLLPDGDMILLVKPQFEVGVGGLGKGGIVRREDVRQAALQRVAGTARDLGLVEHGRMESPIPGTNGNHEFSALAAGRNRRHGRGIGGAS